MRFIFFLILDLCLPTHCRCRGLLLHVIIFRHTHTHTHTDTPHLVGILRASDQLVPETSTWQHTTLTTDIHDPGGIRTCNPSKQESGRRPTPKAALRPIFHTPSLVIKYFKEELKLFCASLNIKPWIWLLVNKTNRCTEFQFYWYYDSTCFGQPFCPSSGVLSRTSALVHFMQLWWTVCYQE